MYKLLLASSLIDGVAEYKEAKEKIQTSVENLHLFDYGVGEYIQGILRVKEVTDQGLICELEVMGWSLNEIEHAEIWVKNGLELDMCMLIDENGSDLEVKLKNV